MKQNLSGLTGKTMDNHYLMSATSRKVLTVCKQEYVDARRYC